jgi:hypothetical protein
MATNDGNDQGNINPSEEQAKRKLEFQKQLNKLLEKQAEYSKEEYRILAETAELLGDMEEARKQRALETEREIVEQYENQINNLTLAEDKKAELLSLSGDLIKELKAGNLEIAKGVDLTEEQTNTLKDFLREKGKQVELDERINKSQKKYGEEQKSLLREVSRGLGLQTTYADSFVGKMTGVIKKLSTGEATMAGFASNFKSVFNVQTVALNVLNKIFDNTMDVLKAFDGAQASIARATGQSREFNNVLYESGRSGNLFGISMQETADAISTMVNQTSAFTNLNRNMQESIALSVSQMGKLGISTDDAAMTFQNFNQALRITASESMDMQKELAMAGVEVGIGAAKITKDFNASLSILMVYGRQSIDVFKGIAAAAKAAGVETSKPKCS